MNYKPMWIKAFNSCGEEITKKQTKPQTKKQAQKTTATKSPPNKTPQTQKQTTLADFKVNATATYSEK